MIINRSRLQPYIRPVYGVFSRTPGPDGNRALVPHLLGVNDMLMTSRLSGSTRAGLTYLFILLQSVAILRTQTSTVYQAAYRYASSFTIKAQSIRAFLLANATDVRLIPRRCLKFLIQRLRASLFVLHRKTIERAP